MERVVTAKIQSFVVMVEMMLTVCVMKGSKETIELYRKIVSKFFNGFLAANLISLGARDSLETVPVEEILRANKETAYSQMTEFVRGVLEVYSVIFVESFQKELEDMDRDITAVVGMIDRYHEIFGLDLKLLEDCLLKHPTATSKLPFSQESLIIRVQLIELPDTYLEFHRKYYNKTCEKCKDFPRVQSCVGFMCLLCG